MSLLIKEMKMPQSCGECHFLTYPFNVPVCSVTGEIFTIPYNRSLRQVLQERKSNCPLEEATEEVRYGKWITKGQDIFCSACGKESAYTWYGASKFSKYCPNCGASMANENEEMSKVSEMEMAYGEYLND